MKITANKWIFLLILAFIIQISANLPDYKLTFEDDHYLTDGILQLLATDLDNDQRDEFVLVGKNDIGREVFLYWLNIDQENKPVVLWQSDNLFEEHSTIWASVGKFSPDQEQLLAFSNSQYYLYQLENGHITLIKQEKHNLQPLNIVCGDVDGDGQAELVVAKIGKITSKIYNCLIQVWKFRDGKLTLIAESDLLGNIRGLSTGDIDQDGVAEIFVEEGPKFAPGNIHMLKYNDQKLSEIVNLKKATKGPAYGMQVKAFPDGMRLVTATATGFIDFFHWDKNTLVPTGKELNLGRDLMSMAVIDARNDKTPSLIVAGYPQQLMILTPEKTTNGEK